MSKTIVHTCSSILVRPNGIVRYINAVIDFQRKMGHHVIFVTDAKPTQTINSDETLYITDTTGYVPNWKDGHVWLQVDYNVVNVINQAFKKLSVEPDLVISHDLHSYLAIADTFTDGIFIQHESDILTVGSRYSFLDDDYLALQRKVVNDTTWRIGMTVDSKTIDPKKFVYTPMPFVPVTMPHVAKTKGLLYMGDSTERKGAKEFMEVARKLGVKPTVITHEVDSALFAGAEVHSFGLDQRDEMYELMAKHKVAFISSKNECPGLVVLECLQFMPVVVDSQYLWTRFLDELGVHALTGDAIVSKISELLDRDDSPGHYDTRLHRWSDHSRKLWTNLIT